MKTSIQDIFKRAADANRAASIASERPFDPVANTAFLDASAARIAAQEAAEEETAEEEAAEEEAAEEETENEEGE